MPLFAMIGRDGPRGPELRKLHREAHLAKLEPLSRQGRVAYAGPLLGEDGQACGSLILFEASDLEAARAIAAADPYVTEGIFASYQVAETRKVFPS
jgi:uncharacterized protein YciI